MCVVFLKKEKKCSFTAWYSSRLSKRGTWLPRVAQNSCKFFGGNYATFVTVTERYFYLGRYVVQLLVGEEPEEFVRRCAIDLRSFHTL